MQFGLVPYTFVKRKTLLLPRRVGSTWEASDSAMQSDGIVQDGHVASDVLAIYSQTKEWIKAARSVEFADKPTTPGHPTVRFVSGSFL